MRYRALGYLFLQSDAADEHAVAFRNIDQADVFAADAGDFRADNDAVLVLEDIYARFPEFAARQLGHASGELLGIPAKIGADLEKPFLGFPSPHELSLAVGH